MKEQGIIPKLFCYVLLVLCTSVIAALAWSGFANGVLFHCTDQMPHLWPPFVHSGSDDRYLAPAREVLLVWVALVAMVFILPALVLWAIRRFGHEQVREPATPPINQGAPPAFAGQLGWSGNPEAQHRPASRPDDPIILDVEVETEPVKQAAPTR
jgi:hypothetical protein